MLLTFKGFVRQKVNRIKIVKKKKKKQKKKRIQNSNSNSFKRHAQCRRNFCYYCTPTYLHQQQQKQK